MQTLSKRPHAASSAVLVLWLGLERCQSHKEGTTPPIPPRHYPFYCCFSPLFIVRCDDDSPRRLEDTTNDVPSPSLFRRTLALLRLKELPFPRKLCANDAVFRDATLQRGLRQRKRDEVALRALQSEAVEAVRSNNVDRIKEVHGRICEIAYGKGVTPQMREDFVIRHGCTGWTDEVLDTLVELAALRGMVEIGAGQGQWARALTERYDELTTPSSKHFDFVLAYDDMSELPLSPEIYHKHTQPAHDYFFAKVKQCADAQSVLRQWPCRGRVLLLVYPPPGNMAVDIVKSYVELGPENDTVVYVGEGRGGANANDAFFDFLEQSGDWIILQVLPVKPPPGGKGYEKLYVLQKLHSQQLGASR